MNMKKMLSLALAGVMALSLMACSAQNGGDSSENTSSPSSSQSSEETQNNETPESVTITSLNANKEAAELEVPYDPQRIAILDMASLDILDALGVGDRVVGTASTSLEYLQDYINDDTPIAEDEITNAFIRLYYKLKHHGEPILMGMITSLQAIRNRRMLWSLDAIELNKQISDLTSQNQMLATLKQQGLIDPDIFISQSNELTEQLRAVKLKKERLLAVDGDNTISQTRELMEILDDGPDFLDNFDAELFGELVETIIVESNERIRFRLKNGLELAETIERTVR